MEQIKFYGRTKGDPKYWPFSNFYHAPFTDNSGTRWETTEHYFQAMKFLPENTIMCKYPGRGELELSVREWVRGQQTPALAAKEGRRRDLPMRSDWEDIYVLQGEEVLVKDTYMYKAIRYKFTQHEDLKQLLLETGDAEIIEDSPIDWYWGCGADGTGKNMLGKLLMKLREEFKDIE